MAVTREPAQPGDDLTGRFRLVCEKAEEHGASDHNFLPNEDTMTITCAWCGRTYAEVYP